MEATAEQIAEFRKYLEEHKNKDQKPDDMSDEELKNFRRFANRFLT